MRCELMQMERMAMDERLGAEGGETKRRMQDIRRRMRQEKERREQEERENEYLGD